MDRPGPSPLSSPPVLAFRPIEVQGRGPVAAGALLWRWQGTLHLTAIVKAILNIRPDGTISPAEPEDLRTDSDRVPYRPRADVLIEGGPRAHGEVVRLALRRDDRTLIDRAIRVTGDPAATPLALGRAAPPWVDRAQPVPEIAATVDWSSFQAAPGEQQTEFLRGDEWILIEGLNSAHPRLVARLPAVHAHGVLYGAIEENGPLERPIELDADTLAIDPARLVCAITWRAAMPITNERDWPRLRLSLGIGLHDRPLLDLTPPSVKSASPSSLESTLDLSTMAPRSATAPAWIGRGPPTRPSEETIRIDAEALAPRSSAPFPIAPPSEPASPSGRTPLPGAPWAPPAISSIPRPASAFEGTLDLTPPPAPPPPKPPPEPIAAPITTRTPPSPVHVEPIVTAPPVEAPPPRTPPAAPPPVPAPAKPRPQPGPDLNQGLYSRFTAKKRQT